LSAAHAELRGLRRVHLGLVDAALAGEGVERVAALAAQELRGTVAIVLPALDIAVASPPVDAERLYAAADHAEAEVPVRSGDEHLGSVLLLGRRERPDAEEVLELAALAAVTAVALRDTRVTRRRSAAALLDELDALPAARVLARARRLGADLGAGAYALSVRPPSERTLARIAQDVPEALAAVREDRVDALLPATAAAHRLARRLGAGLAPLETDAASFGAALREAQLALAVAETEGVRPDELPGTGWRLLLRAGARDPEAVRAAVTGTIEPLLGRGDLLDTVRAYLREDGNMNAAAGRIFAHRHTVAHRLKLVRELTGLDPQTGAGLAELALGLKALVVREALGAPAPRLKLVDDPR
jgi:hypothetical protein